MQQKDTADSKTDQELRASARENSERYNKNDATALAALFTEDAVLVTPEGLLYGRQAIEKNYAGAFQQWHPTNHIAKVDQVNAIGDVAWKLENGVVLFKPKTVLCQLRAITHQYLFARAMLGKNASSYNMAPTPA